MVRFLVRFFVVAILVGCSEPPAPPDVAEPQSVSPMERAPDGPVTGQAESSDGLEIVFDARGAGETTLVFVHGWACNRHFWRHQLDAFADDYRVIALDLGGHGQSGTQRDPFTVKGLAADVQAVVEQIGANQVVLVGHSMGGPVSLEAARLMPDRVIAVVGADTLHDATTIFSAEQIEQFVGAFDAEFEGTLRGMFDGMAGGGLDAAQREWIVDEAVKTPPRVATDLLRDYANFELSRMLADTPVPVRVINAAAGGAIPATNLAANAQLADFDALIVPGVGHFLQLEDPVSFNRHLRAVLATLLPLQD